MIQKILWFRADAIGDSVLAFSMLPHIKILYPHAKITGLCQDFLMDVYSESPYFNTVLSFNKKQFVCDKNYRESFLQQLRDQKFDVVLNSAYSRELSMDSLATSIGAREVVGFKVFKRRGRWDFPFRYNQSYSKLIQCANSWISELEKSAIFLKELGAKGVGELLPLLWVSQEALLFVDAFIKSHAIDHSKIIILCAGALSDQRKYPLYGKALADFLYDKEGYTVIALGGKNDCAITQENVKYLSVNYFDLCGKTSLLEAAAFIQRAALVVGAETGLTHIACAVGTKNVVLLGGGHFGRFMPYSPLTTVVSLPLACFGCDWKCPYKKAHCVQDVDYQMISYAMDLALNSNLSDRSKIILQKKKLSRKKFGEPRWELNERVYDVNNIEIIFW